MNIVDTIGVRSARPVTGKRLAVSRPCRARGSMTTRELGSGRGRNITDGHGIICSAVNYRAVQGNTHDDGLQPHLKESRNVNQYGQLERVHELGGVPSDANLVIGYTPPNPLPTYTATQIVQALRTSWLGNANANNDYGVKRS